jgi:hypothetical protein
MQKKNWKGEHVCSAPHEIAQALTGELSSRQTIWKGRKSKMKDAVGEVDVLGRLVQWANSQPLVRAMVLESSRASDRAPIDALSDYDVLLVVSDTRPFSRDETWLQHLGNILVLFRDQGWMYGRKHYNRLVLYEDGTKIDYIVWPVALLQRVLGELKLPDLLDHGYQVLVDKDHLTRELKPPRTAPIFLKGQRHKSTSPL